MKLIKEIKGFEDVKGKYFITTCGKVVTNSNNSRNVFLSAGKNKKGYYQVVLYTDNNLKKRPYVHKLVALAYIENPKNKEQVDHIDNNKENNHIYNLQWMTNSENNWKRVKAGDTCYNRKLTPDDVRAIRKSYSELNVSFIEFHKLVGKNFNLSEKSLRYLIRGKTYAWVTGE